MRFKKRFVLPLVASLLFSSVMPINIAKALEDNPTLNEMDKISSDYSVSMDFLQGEMNKGYTLTDVKNALALSQLTHLRYEETIQQAQPAILNESDSAKSQVVNEVVNQKVLDESVNTLVLDSSQTPPTGKIEIPKIGGKTDEAPYSVSLSNENISTLSGGLSMQAADMTLKGRNGLDFTLSRSYDSTMAQFHDMDVLESANSTYTYWVWFDSTEITEARPYRGRWEKWEYVMKDEDGDERTSNYPDRHGCGCGDDKFNSYDYSGTLYTKASIIGAKVTAENKTYTPSNWDTRYKPMWRYEYYPKSGTFVEQIYDQASPLFVSTRASRTVKGPFYSQASAEAEKASVIKKYGQQITDLENNWGSDNTNTYNSVRKTNFYADFNPTISPSYEGTTYSYSNKVVQPVREKVSPIGTGWSWNIPYISNRDDKKYLNMANGSSYEINGTSLKGYPWKDLQFTTDTSVRFNGETSAYLLNSVNTGEKQYFNADGRLLQISDSYGNFIRFQYSTHPTYGKVLSQITNSIGNSISLTYTAQEVKLTQGSQTVVYSKQTTTDQGYTKDILSQVTDVAGRKTTYDYSIKPANFNLVRGYASDRSNPYVLLTGVTHPTGAKTVYQYEDNATVRYLGENATNEVYRVKSVEDQVKYTNGTVGVFNRNTVTYNGDMGSTFDANSSFSTTLDNNSVKRTFDYKKDYNKSNNIPLVYYNTKVSESAGAEQRIVTNTFDEVRRLLTPKSTSTSYVKNGVVLSTQNLSSVYDEYGNILTYTDTLGVTTLYEYDSNHYLKSMKKPITTSQTQVSEFVRNAQGSVTQMSLKDQSGTVLKQQNFLYDSYGNATETQTRNGSQVITTRYEYPAANQYAFPAEVTTEVTDADGVKSSIVKQYEYDLSTGRMKKSIDGKGYVSTILYDALGRVTKITLPNQATQVLSYDDLNNQTKFTDERGFITVTKWNPLGWKVEEGVEVGGVYTAKSKYKYDNLGNLILSEDALGNPTTFTFDAWKRNTSTLYADGQKQSVQYDDANLSQTTTDADNNVVRETMDKLGRVIKTENGNNLVENVTYDNLGHVLTSNDGKNNLTSYEYNAAGYLTKVAGPEGIQTKYLNDALGNTLEVLFDDGKKIVNKYDEAGRIIQKTNESGQSVKFFYDPNDNLIKQIDHKRQVTEYEYNNLNLMVAKKVKSESGITETTTYAYDQKGNRIQMTDSTGTTNYSYNLKGELESVTYPDGKKISYLYNNNGIREKMVDPFGLEILYKTDSRDRLKTVTFGTKSLEANYQYSAGGKLSQIRYPNGMTSAYEFGSTGQIKSILEKNSNGSVQQKLEYVYDLSGNLEQTKETDDKNTTNSYNYTYDKMNRLKTSTRNNSAYEYDTRGNLQTKATSDVNLQKDADFNYNNWNQLASVKTNDQEVTYKYNGDGLLYERSYNGETIRYYYDGTQVIAEAIVTTGGVTLKARYLRGLGLIARQDNKGSNAYYFQNAHGDVTELRDSNGQILNRYSYDEWGNPLSVSEKVENPFRYASEYWDDVTQLLYLRARWYDPSVARFIGEDTYQGQTNNPMSLNLYSYAYNNPLKYSDPSGHSPETDLYKIAVKQYPWLVLASDRISMAQFNIIDYSSTINQAGSHFEIPPAIIAGIIFKERITYSISDEVAMADTWMRGEQHTHSVGFGAIFPATARTAWNWLNEKNPPEYRTPLPDSDFGLQKKLYFEPEFNIQTIAVVLRYYKESIPETKGIPLSQMTESQWLIVVGRYNATSYKTVGKEYADKVKEYLPPLNIILTR